MYLCIYIICIYIYIYASSIFETYVKKLTSFIPTNVYMVQWSMVQCFHEKAMLNITSSKSSKSKLFYFTGTLSFA